jgi:hypothetical protein
MFENRELWGIFGHKREESADKFGLFIKYYNMIKIKNRFNSENACYHSVQSFVFPPAV